MTDAADPGPETRKGRGLCPAGGERVFTCTGPSMRPLLRPGDGLTVRPYAGRAVRRGDVVVFPKPGGGKQTVVHRVVAVGAGGVRTRGDRNPGPDPWVLRPEDILGRVVSRQRRDRERAVPGALPGRLQGLAMTALRRGDRALSRALHPWYRSLAGSGIFSRWVPGFLAPRVLAFPRPGGQELKLVVGHGTVIGRLPSGENRWRIRRPFRVFLKQEDLDRWQAAGSPREEARHGNGS